MNKINWKEKLTSRKFWLSVAGLTTGIVLLCQGAGSLDGVVMALGSVVAYCIGEGLADSGGAAGECVETTGIAPDRNTELPPDDIGPAGAPGPYVPGDDSGAYCPPSSQGGRYT